MGPQYNWRLELAEPRAGRRRQEDHWGILRAAILTWSVFLWLCRAECQRRRDQTGDSPTSIYADMSAEQPWCQFLQKKVPWKVIWTDSSDMDSGSLSVPLTVSSVLTQLKICQKKTDVSTRLAKAIFRETRSKEELTWKVYMVVTTGSRSLLQSRGLQDPWSDFADAKNILKDLAPSDFYHGSYRPQSIRRNVWLEREREVGLSQAKHEFWTWLLDQGTPKPVHFKKSGNRHCSRKEVFDQILEWPQTGDFAAKNAFQYLREQYRHGEGVCSACKRTSKDSYASTGPGTRQCLNVFAGAAGGVRFLADSTAAGVSSFFAQRLAASLAAMRRSIRDVTREVSQESGSLLDMGP